MAKSKEKKNENNLSEKNVIERSKKLLYYKNTFTLGNLKILDTYLSRINPRNDKDRTVRFTKEEFENLLGVCKVRPEQLKNYTEGLSKTVNIISDDNQGYDCITLFSRNKCFQDENGKWVVELTCSPEAKKLFFNLRGVGYLKYQLKNIIHLNSEYSINLYYYLLDNQYQNTWIASLDELKNKVFRVKNSQIYDDYKYFSSKIIKKAISEINEKTNITVNYSAVRTGRYVTHIQFEIVSTTQLVTKEDNKKQITDNCSRKVSDILTKMSEVCKGTFAVEQLQCLYDLMQKLDAQWLSKSYPANTNEESYLKYFTEKYHEMVVQKPENKFAYIKKMISSQDTSEQPLVVHKRNTRFAVLEQKPSYDIEELENRNTFQDLHCTRSSKF